tara:strand:- start:190 stop:468 length:279 start_codon:yes stop_codon:yes gene_type:complete
MSKSVKKVKVSPLIRVFDAIRDEKLDVIFDKHNWVEVSANDWKRLKESKTNQGDTVMSTFVEESEGVKWEVADVVEKTTISDEADIVVEEEE